MIGRVATKPPRYADAMLAAEIWHWWIGVLLVLGCIVLVVAFVGGYLKSITSQQYPGRRNRRDD